MTREQILRLYITGRWFRANGQLSFPRMAIDAYKRGLIHQDEYFKLGIDTAEKTLCIRISRNI